LTVEFQSRPLLRAGGPLNVKGFLRRGCHSKGEKCKNVRVSWSEDAVEDGRGKSKKGRAKKYIYSPRRKKEALSLK